MLMYLFLHFNFGYYRKVGVFCKTKDIFNAENAEKHKCRLKAKKKKKD